MRILFVASEGLPFSKTGGLADVIEALPKALVSQGHEVAVVLPRYRGTQVKNILIKSLTVPMGKELRFAAIADGMRPHGVQYFFVDDPKYFDREQLYGVGGRDYPDNGERFAEFGRAAVELAKQLWPADVIHCHDWQSALLPVLMRTLYEDDPVLAPVPVVFTIHNMGYHGLFSRDLLGRIGLPDSLFRIEALEFFDRINFLKGGLVFSDYLTTVSRKYAEEIQTPEYGHGLDGVVRSRADRLVGILNGVDYSVWNPEVDALIAQKYSARDLTGKQACKKQLLAEFRLPESDLQKPLIGIVSRFADQKGFDLLAQVMSSVVKEDVMIVALGAGEAKHEQMMRELAVQHPDKIAVKIAYDNTLAHKIEAGADMLLMPSRYEPCGLNQIYSLRYGTVPVVRATGGLDDTIETYDRTSGQGTGFKFTEYTGEALLGALRVALGTYRDQAAWKRLQTKGMAKDFSWNASATEYAQLYELARKARIRSSAASSKKERASSG